MEDGLQSVQAEAVAGANNEPTDAPIQSSGQRQGDLQRATMLERLSALHAKQTQLQVDALEHMQRRPGMQSARIAASHHHSVNRNSMQLGSVTLSMPLCCIDAWGGINTCLQVLHPITITLLNSNDMQSMLCVLR